MIDDDVRVGDWVSTEPPDHPAALPSARVPHLGHALLFLAIAGLFLILAQVAILLPLMRHSLSPMAEGMRHPKLLLASEGATYLLTFVIAWFVFPLFWHRSLAAGIDWHGATARRLASRLIPLGIITGWSVQAISSLIHMPKTVPMDDFFRSESDVWLVTFFGTLVAPLFEEVCFRGFLLPAFTIAFDWLAAWVPYLSRFSSARLDGDPPPQHLSAFPEAASAGLAPASTGFGSGNMGFRSLPAVILASLLTSALFALLHAQQLGYTWGAVLLLGGVSLVLTAVRIRTRSVACSTLVHGSYNFSVFIVLFIATGGYRHLERVAR